MWVSKLPILHIDVPEGDVHSTISNGQAVVTVLHVIIFEQKVRPARRETYIFGKADKTIILFRNWRV